MSAKERFDSHPRISTAGIHPHTQLYLLACADGPVSVLGQLQNTLNITHEHEYLLLTCVTFSATISYNMITFQSIHLPTIFRVTKDHRIMESQYWEEHSSSSIATLC